MGRKQGQQAEAVGYTVKCWGLTTPNAIRTQNCCSQQLLYSGLFRACLCRACLDLPQFHCLQELSSEPLLWAYSLHRSSQSELCCYAAPQAEPFSPVLVTASLSVLRHPFAIFVWLDFLKHVYFSSYFSPLFLTPFNLHPRLLPRAPPHQTHTVELNSESLTKKSWSKTESNL